MTKSSCGVWSWYKPQTCASGFGLDRAEEFGVPSPQADASRKLGISKKEKINKEINKNVLGTRARLHTNDNSSPRCRRLALECLHHSRQQKGILKSLFYFLIRQTLIIIKKDALPSTHHLACASARLPPRRTGHVKKKIRIYLLPIFLQGRQSREVARFVHNL